MKRFAALLFGFALIAPAAAQTAETPLGLPNTARLLICEPGEWVEASLIDANPWVTIHCNRYGEHFTPSGERRVHQRTALVFNGAECQPWIVIVYQPDSVSVYCAPRAAQ